MKLLSLPRLLIALVVMGLCVPAAASATHEQGGNITARITALGHLQGTVTYITSGACTVGTPTGQYPITVKSPAGTTAAVTTDTATYTRCVAGSTTQTANFDIDLAATFSGIVPDGQYKVTFSSCCRVNGSRNIMSTATSFEAAVTKTGLVPSSTPVINSDVALGIAKGYDYSQNLNARDPDGTALTYQSRAGQPDGPSTDIVTYSSNGNVFIPASTTSTFTHGWTFVYKVRVVDAAGDYAERDVLLRTTANNIPPVLNLDSSYDVEQGTTRVINFTATDANNASPKIDSVNMTTAGLPSWATISVTPGNPAQGTLTLSPPAETPLGSESINIDAFDNDAVAPLLGSKNVSLNVIAPQPPETSIGTAPSGTITTRTPAFTFSSTKSGTFECRIDGGSWATCTSPHTPAPLADGSHTFEVRAIDATSLADASPASVTWTIDATAPAAPAIDTKPAAVSSSKTFEFSGPGGDAVTTECKIDSGAWTDCTSPFTPAGLADGPHTFEVRALDAAGNATTVPATHSWTLDTVAPAVPTIGTKPAAVSPTSKFEFDTPAGSTVECSVDGGSWVLCTSPLALTGLADGAHTLKVRSFDAAGNRSEAASAQWTLDTGAPAKPVIESAPNAVAQVSTFAFTVPSGDTAECVVDGGEWAACTSPFTAAGLADGAHTFKVRYVDNVGNRSEEAAASWTLDTSAPAAPALTSAPESSTTATSARFDWTGEGGGSFECKVDGGTFAQCAAPFSIAGLAIGKHTFTVRQLDVAGNVGAERTVEWTVTREPEPPAPEQRPSTVQPVTGANATVAVQGDTASVGCKVTNGTLSSCFVDVFAYDKPDENGVNVSGSKVHAKTRATGKRKLVLIGRGRIKAGGDGASRLAVDIELNATGRRLVAEQVTGIRVILKIEARTVQGPKLNTRTAAKLVPQKQLIVPEKGLFASGSSKVAKAGAKLFKRLGDRLGRVKAVTCIGHTDSIGTEAANEKLGLARAKAVCKALRKNGARGTIVVKSAGETRPRATNSTVKGRALNRRVEISVRYR